jgi:hypothetical protein
VDYQSHPYHHANQNRHTEEKVEKRENPTTLDQIHDDYDHHVCESHTEENHDYYYSHRGQ